MHMILANGSADEGVSRRRRYRKEGRVVAIHSSVESRPVFDLCRRLPSRVSAPQAPATIIER
jgi:hypothetical protein